MAEKIIVGDIVNIKNKGKKMRFIVVTIEDNKAWIQSIDKSFKFFSIDIKNLKLIIRNQESFWRS